MSNEDEMRKTMDLVNGHVTKAGRDFLENLRETSPDLGKKELDYAAHVYSLAAAQGILAVLRLTPQQFAKIKIKFNDFL